MSVSVRVWTRRRDDFSNGETLFLAERVAALEELWVQSAFDYDSSRRKTAD